MRWRQYIDGILYGRSASRRKQAEIKTMGVLIWHHNFKLLGYWIGTIFMQCSFVRVEIHFCRDSCRSNLKIRWMCEWVLFVVLNRSLVYNMCFCCCCIRQFQCQSHFEMHINSMLTCFIHGNVENKELNSSQIFCFSVHLSRNLPHLLRLG